MASDQQKRDVADRIRRRLREDPTAAGRIADAVADICECGGSIKHDEHAEDCPHVERAEGGDHE